ncbi:Uncharacterized protein dnm_030820 [Desulfonema magnum]|uniref:Uncharacterized protein n=1 Tax=Desulfonema magnum TaxID=45655 RepID=A0A975BL11_9BACT|nr:Uncharacterized protein dnm_030820 [Desulfonema magnum]
MTVDTLLSNNLQDSVDRKVSGLCAGQQRNPAFFSGRDALPPEKAGFLPRLSCDSLKTFRSTEIV